MYSMNGIIKNRILQVTFALVIFCCLSTLPLKVALAHETVVTPDCDWGIVDYQAEDVQVSPSCDEQVVRARQLQAHVYWIPVTGPCLPSGYQNTSYSQGYFAKESDDVQWQYSWFDHACLPDPGYIVTDEHEAYRQHPGCDTYHVPVVDGDGLNNFKCVPGSNNPPSVYLIGALGLGLFISTVTDTQQQVMFIAFFFMLTFMLMSGIFTPVESMPLCPGAIGLVDASQGDHPCCLSTACCWFCVTQAP